MQQRLKEMLRLALGFALLGAQPLEFADGALFIESGLKHEWHERARNVRKPFAAFVHFVSFVIDTPPERPVQRQRQRPIQLRPPTGVPP